jgi:hypothetical protein
MKEAESQDGTQLPNTKAAIETALLELSQDIGTIPDIISLTGSVESGYGKIELYKSHELAVDPAMAFEVIGTGEESLVSYLKHNLYSSDMSLKEATALAVYIILMGKQYNPQYCGGRTDVEVLTKEYPLRTPVSYAKVEELEEAFKIGGRRHLKALLGEVAGLLK